MSVSVCVCLLSVLLSVYDAWWLAVALANTFRVLHLRGGGGVCMMYVSIAV